MSRIQRLAEKGDLLTWLSAEGRVFYAADADADDLVTAQTSFATTTPTFLLTVPSGTTAIPLRADLTQAGTVAGGAITVVFEIDNAARYASGGTAETVLASRTTGGKTNGATLYSGATATDAYGVRVGSFLVGQDVSPAEGAPNKILWTPEAGLDFLVGPAAFLVFTWAAATAPTWAWAFKWADFPTDWMN